MHLKHYHSRLTVGYKHTHEVGTVIIAPNESRADHDKAQDSSPADRRSAPPGHDTPYVVRGCKRPLSTTTFTSNPTDLAYVKRRRPARRQRFSSRSNLPVSPDDEHDSDTEVDMTWLHQMHAASLDDFIDLSAPEKTLMTLWSAYLLDNPVLADAHMEPVCRAFITEYSDALRPLRNNFMLHIATLRDYAILTVAQAAALIAHANATLGS